MDQSRVQAEPTPTQERKPAPPEADADAYATAAQALWKAADQSRAQAGTVPAQDRKAPPEADADVFATAAQALWKAADQSRAQATVPAEERKPAPPEADADAYATAAKALWTAADQSRAQEERKPAPPDADAVSYATVAKALWKAADQSKVQAAATPGEESKTKPVAEADSATKPEPTPSDTVVERSAAETAKALTESKADSSSVPPAKPTSVPAASTNETPRSYVDPLPAVESAPQHGLHCSLSRNECGVSDAQACRLRTDPAAAVASDLKVVKLTIVKQIPYSLKIVQALVQKHTFLNPATAKCRHPLHCWVSRCAQAMSCRSANRFLLEVQVLLSDPAEAQV